MMCALHFSRCLWLASCSVYVIGRATCVINSFSNKNKRPAVPDNEAGSDIVCGTHATHPNRMSGAPGFLISWWMFRHFAAGICNPLVLHEACVLTGLKMSRWSFLRVFTASFHNGVVGTFTGNHCGGWSWSGLDPRTRGHQLMWLA